MAEFDSNHKIVATKKFRGKGRLIAKDLRKLPSELVTDEHADTSKIHTLDPSHIKRKLIEDYKTKQFLEEIKSQRPTYMLRGKVSQHGQRGIDFESIRAFKGVLRTIWKLLVRGERNVSNPCYLWFPEDRLSKVELRVGPVPSNSNRPRWLKRMDLLIDPGNIPKRLYDIMKSHNDADLDDMLKISLVALLDQQQAPIDTSQIIGVNLLQ